MKDNKWSNQHLRRYLIKLKQEERKPKPSDNAQTIYQEQRAYQGHNWKGFNWDDPNAYPDFDAWPSPVLD